MIEQFILVYLLTGLVLTIWGVNRKEIKEGHKKQYMEDFRLNGLKTSHLTYLLSFSVLFLIMWLLWVQWVYIELKEEWKEGRKHGK